MTKGAANDCSVVTPPDRWRHRRRSRRWYGWRCWKPSRGQRSGVQRRNTRRLGRALQRRAQPADVSGWRFKDNDNTHAFYVIPLARRFRRAASWCSKKRSSASASAPPRAHGSIFQRATNRSCPTHGPPHASDDLRSLPRRHRRLCHHRRQTKGTANNCGAPPTDGGTDGGSDPNFPAWPASSGVKTVDTLAAFGGNMSGLFYEARTKASPTCCGPYRTIHPCSIA